MMLAKKIVSDGRFSKQRSLKLSVYYEFCEHLYCLLTMATMVLTAWEVVSSPLGRATMQEPR